MSFCRYFLNDQHCPFDERGCKLRHDASGIQHKGNNVREENKSNVKQTIRLNVNKKCDDVMNENEEGMQDMDKITGKPDDAFNCTKNPIIIISEKYKETLDVFDCTKDATKKYSEIFRNL